MPQPYPQICTTHISLALLAICFYFTWLSFTPSVPLEKDDFVWLADDFFPSNVFIEHMKVLSYVSLVLHSALNWITTQRMLQ